MAEQEEQVQNQVEEAEKPKRKRRTKEEIEADKRAKEQAKKKKAKEKAKEEAEKEARKAEREAKKEAYEALIDESKNQLDKAIASGKNKKTVPLDDNNTVKDILDDEKFDVDIKCQRQADQWKDNKKSQFILSILTGKDLSEIIVYKKPDGNYAVIDGKQRITTLRNFLDNELVLKLGSKEEPHYLDGKKFSKEIDENGNTTFEGLDEDYQNIIRNRELRIEELIGYTDEEADEQFKLKNSGVAVNISQILKLGIKEDRADKLQKLIEDEATKRFKISEASKKKDVVRDVIIKSILLINNPDITSFSTKDIYNELNKLEDNEFNEACEKLEKAFEALRDYITGQQTWLKPTSIPFAMYAVANGAEYKPVSDIIEEEDGKFKAASQKGVAGKASIQDRRKEMDTLIK